MATRASRIALAGSNISSTGEVDADLLDNTDSAAFLSLNGGKLLIGDTASHTTDLLQIESPASGGGYGIQIRRNDSNNDQQVGHILFGNNTATDLASIFVKTDGATDSGAIAFNTSVTGGANTERMRIDSSGDVGIGTSTNLSSSSWNAGSRFLTIDGTAGDSYGVLNLRGDRNNTGTSRHFQIGAGDGNLYLAHDGNNNAHRLVVYPDGDIGLGGVANSANGGSYDTNVHIRSVGASTSLKLTDSGTGGHGTANGFEFISSGGNGYIWNRKDSGAVSIGTAGLQRLLVDYKGTLGIGNIGSAGVTPKTNWGAVFGARSQWDTQGVIAATDGSMQFGHNWYYDDSVYKRLGTGKASRYVHVNDYAAWEMSNTSAAADSNITDFQTRMKITGDGRLQINNYTVSAGAAISAKSAISSNSPIVVASQNYATTFAVLPWSAGITYISSGTHYSNGTWKADGASAGASLLSFSGEQGLHVYFGSGTADAAYNTYVSDKKVVTKYGLVVNNEQSYNTGYGTGAGLLSTSSSWATLPITGTGATGERAGTNVLKFDKLDNDSDMTVSISFPYYSPASASGFGIRLRYSVNSGSSYGTDWLTNGPAHGWGAGGYGNVSRADMFSFTWNTEDMVANTYIGEVRFYFEVKVWNNADQYYFNDYSGYSKYGYIHIKEISRLHK